MPHPLASSISFLTQPSVQKRTSRIAWLSIAIFASLLVIVPIFSIVLKSFNPSKPIWGHLYRTVLPIYIRDTLMLTLGVGALTILIGVTTAYLVARFSFRGRRWLEWLLILPLAMPTYLIAFVYTDLLEYAGPVQGALREVMGYQSARDYHFFEIRSMGGGIVTMALVLYPYVYLMARTALIEQSNLFSLSARTLGKTRLQTFFTVVLPMARPAIMVGVLLVIMEVLNDFGAVSYFAIHTFSEGVYDFWLGRNNRGGASQIALLLLFIVITLMLLEQHARKHQRYTQTVKSRMATRTVLSGKAEWLVIVACALPVIFGFMIPVARLVWFVVQNHDNALDFSAGWEQLWHSLSLSTVAGIVTVTLALLVAYARRMFDTKLINGLAITSGLGYAMPGAILAIGLMLSLGEMDAMLNHLAVALTGERIGLFFSGTLFAVILAYVIRFTSVAHGSAHAALQKVTPSMDYSAKSLGCTPRQLLTRVHIPIIRKGLLTAFLIVFVDSMKELPATLILRPFNFDTLATHVYQYASDERLEESALSALFIVLAGLIPIIWLNKMIRGDEHDD